MMKPGGDSTDSAPRKMLAHGIKRGVTFRQFHYGLLNPDSRVDSIAGRQTASFLLSEEKSSAAYIRG